MELVHIGVPLVVAAVVSGLMQLLKKVAVVDALPTQGKQALVLALAFVVSGILERLHVPVDSSAVLAGLGSMGIYTLYKPIT